MPKTQVSRATYVKQWRENNHKNKRFNKPMREYIELKYGDIYVEYCAFFKALDEKHPASKDLTKTRTYKNWKREQLRNEQTESEDEQEATTSQTEPDTTEQDTTGNRTEPTEPDAAAAPFEETLPIVNINEADNIIDQIINGLEQDEAVRNILNGNNHELVHPNYEDEDEGIGLNAQTELEAIVEPFDYALEVEGFEEYNLEGFDF